METVCNWIAWGKVCLGGCFVRCISRMAQRLGLGWRRANGRAIIVQCLSPLSCYFDFVGWLSPACLLSLSLSLGRFALTSPFLREIHYRRRCDLDTDCEDRSSFSGTAFSPSKGPFWYTRIMPTLRWMRAAAVAALATHATAQQCCKMDPML